MEPTLQPPPLPPGLKYLRPLGWLLVVIGSGLSAAMALLTFYLRGVIAEAGHPGSRVLWNGSPDFTRTTFELFGAVFFFGLMSLGAGIVQVRTGRRSMPFLLGMFVLVAVMFYLGYAIIGTGAASEGPPHRTY